MDQEEKIKLKIQRLQAQSDYRKFEYSQITTYYIGIIACLLAIFIPIIPSLKDINLILISTLFLFILIWFTNYKLKRHFKSNSDEIKTLSKQIESLYSELLI
jgi:uncharacterized protein YacL